MTSRNFFPNVRHWVGNENVDISVNLSYKSNSTGQYVEKGLKEGNWSNMHVIFCLFQLSRLNKFKSFKVTVHVWVVYI